MRELTFALGGLALHLRPTISGLMSRHIETRDAMIALLRTFGRQPTSIYEVGVPMHDSGFTQDEIVDCLYALERERVIKLLPTNSFQVLNLPK